MPFEVSTTGMKAELFYSGNGTKWTSGDQSQLCAKDFLIQLFLSTPGILTRNSRLVFRSLPIDPPHRN